MIRSMFAVTFTAMMFALGGSSLRAQSADDRMRLGDAAAAAFKTDEALAQYEAIIQLDSSNLDALRKASMNAIDLGELEKDKKKREALYRKGERLARRAVAVNDEDPEAHFHLSRALGMAALSVGPKQRVRYAREVREHAMAALKALPTHAGALHVMGVWNAEVMRLSFAERMVAKTLLGANFFSEASWEDALRYMEQSVAVDPERLTHYLDLARIYRDRNMTEKARAAFTKVIDGKVRYVNDPLYKQQAAAELARLRKEEAGT